MLPEPLPPPIERPPSPSPKDGLAGSHALGVTRTIGLAAAGTLGTVVVIGIPLLLRQQAKVAAALSDVGAGSVAQEIARLNVLHWIVLGLAGAAAIC